MSRMRLDELVPMAFEALVLNKVRTGLTMLGIVIGVMSVITMIGLGQASQAQITAQVQGLGAATIIVSSGSPKVFGFGRGGGGGNSAQGLTLSDARALDNLPGTTDVAPMAQSGTLVKVGKLAVGGTAIGATNGIQDVRGLKLAQGRFFTEQEAETGARVAVLGAKVARELFTASGEAPLGAKVLVGKRRYRVVGVIEEQGGFGSVGQEVYMPIRAYQAAFKGGTKIGSILVKAESEALLPGMQEAIRGVLRQRHALATSDDDDFRMQTQEELLTTIGNITQVFTGLLAGIAGISLLVGGIGIMNIMLVSVTERTREIGIRKALGARRRHIMLQFLVESGTLSLAGGVVGVALGLAATAAATRALSLPYVVSLGAIAGAFVFSAGVGVFFGAYPAHVAARLDPVDALRYE